DLFLSPTPRRNPTSVSAGVLVFQKTEYWDQLSSLSRSQNAKPATARFLRRGFPYGFFSRDTMFCLYNEVSYPGPHPLPTTWVPKDSERNMTYAPENIVRMKRGKIVTHYILSLVEPVAYHIQLDAGTFFGMKAG